MEQSSESRQDKFHRLSLRLQRTAFFVMSFMVMLSFMMTNLQALLWQSSDWLVGAVLPGVVATLTNTEREKYAVAPLSRSSILDAAARMKAEHMAAEGYFSHDSPGGITPWYWFERAGYVYAHAGENLAVHFQDSDEVVRAWMNSPTHKANVIAPQYTEIGIGTAKGRYQGYDTVFVVQLFGTPAKRPAVVLLSQGESNSLNEENLTTVSTSGLTISQTDEILEVDNDSTVAMNTITDDFSLAPTTSMKEHYVIYDDSSGEVESITVSVASNKPADNYSLTDSFVATSSGLLPYLEGREFVAGTTAPAMSSLATQPRTVLQIIYTVLGGIVMLLLIVSIIFGYRTHHLKTVLIGVGLLVLMSLLFLWHVYITSGAVVV